MEEKLSPRRRLYDRGMRGLVWLCAGLTCALLLFLIGYIFYRGVPGITWSLLTSQTSYIKNTVGILPNILDTLYIIVVAMVIVSAMTQVTNAEKEARAALFVLPSSEKNVVEVKKTMKVAKAALLVGPAVTAVLLVLWAIPYLSGV